MMFMQQILKFLQQWRQLEYAFSAPWSIMRLVLRHVHFCSCLLPWQEIVGAHAEFGIEFLERHRLNIKGHSGRHLIMCAGVRRQEQRLEAQVRFSGVPTGAAYWMRLCDRAIRIGSCHWALWQASSEER